MGIKLHIFLLLVCGVFRTALAEEKFLSISGTLLDEDSRTALSGYSVKVVQDKLDSTTTAFAKSEFQVWAPANRRTMVYFIKEGYVTKQVYIDASYIPSIAFKQKQAIELEIIMTATAKVGKRNFSKPIMTASYDAQSNSFVVKEEQVTNSATTARVSDDYQPPFPTPVDTYKGAQPTANDLALTTSWNTDKSKSGSPYTKLIQGILFADMNYCFFNERTNDANLILTKLTEIDYENWGNLKPFDSPEYGKIIMRTINREKGVDTLFALGVFVETSRLMFENFTSDSKVIVHLKKFKEVMNSYKPVGLTSEQKAVVESLQQLVPWVMDLEKKYTESLRNKTDFDLSADELFLQVRSSNKAIYESIIG